MRTQLYFLFLFFAIFIIQAQETTQKDSVTVLDEVILTETLKIKNASGITPSTSIGSKVFQNYSPIDVVSSINQVSGVFVLSGALNTNRITIRGVGARTPFGTDKLRLYYNEIPVTNGTGFSTIEAYDLENLNAVEVIKGPKATAFGTNLGGAIVLNSKETQEKNTEFVNNFTVGSYKLLKNNISFSHTGNRLSLGLQYGHTEIDGYRENNSFERDGILLNASYKINDKSKVGLLVNHIDYSAQIASSISQTAFDENPTQAAFTWKASQGYEANKYTLLGASYSYKFNQKLKNTTSIFYTYLDHYEPRPFNILDEITNGYGFRTNFSGKFDFKEQKAHYSIGAELYKDEYNWSTFENDYELNNGNGSLAGNRLSDNKEFRKQLNTFGFVNFPFTKNFTGQIGLNINKTSYDFRDLFNTSTENKSAKRDFKTIFLPSLNLSYTLSQTHKIYGNISRGFSNPSLEETLTPDGLINTDIKQETGINYELGTQLFLDHKKLNIDIALYRMDIKNLLVAERIGEDQFIGKNAGSTKHQGLDLSVNYVIDVSSTIHLTPFINYTLSDHSFVKFIDGDNNYSGNPLTGVPKHRLNSGLQIQFMNGFYWNTTHQFVDKISLRDANTLYSDSYTIFNTRMGYKKQLTNKFSIGLDFGINNIGDTKYAQSVLINARGFGGREPRYFYPGNNRNYYGSVGLGYKL